MPKYPVTASVGPIHIDDTFTYHAPHGDQVARFAENRDAAKEFAKLLVSNCPPCAELTLALRAIQTAMFHANAAMAINEKPQDAAP